MPTRLTSLDASFLHVESPHAHMHVGWVAVFAPPEGSEPPGFAEIRAHVAGRLCRAPRYRQRLTPVPLGLGDPVWVDAEDFDLDEHIIRSDARRLDPVVDATLSAPLRRDRPLWELRVADRLEGGRIGIVGKAHHCMVDGMAAVELASLLLDPSPRPEHLPEAAWRPAGPPSQVDLVADALRDRVRDGLHAAMAPVRIAGSPRRIGELVARGREAADALASSLVPATPGSGLNAPISPRRHLGRTARALSELRAVKDHYGVTLNDVLLAVAAGGIRGYLRGHGVAPPRLKTMVPVSLRAAGDAADLGNRISFIFVDLPCDEPDPERRLLNVHLATSERKRRGDARGGDAVMRAFGYTPRTVQWALSRLVASPRTFNLVVSNIPGPQEPLYMLGARLEEAYPVVPLADGHALSVGMTTVGDGAFFGVYADQQALPDADVLTAEIDFALDELLERCAPRTAPAPEPALV